MLSECQATSLVPIPRQGRQRAWALHLCGVTAPASGKGPAASPPQPDNAGQTPCPALPASHKSTWWERAHATDSAAPSNTHKQLVNIKAAANLCHSLAEQAPRRLDLWLLRVGPGYGSTMAKVKNMDKLMDGHTPPPPPHHRN